MVSVIVEPICVLSSKLCDPYCPSPFPDLVPDNTCTLGRVGLVSGGDKRSDRGLCIAAKNEQNMKLRNMLTVHKVLTLRK